MKVSIMALFDGLGPTILGGVPGMLEGDSNDYSRENI